ncbi:tetratricopeptide repeat protein [Kibdelosporangium aridum]|uniref:tetratricopeptide repeat protein n=1 Tax=Kibdelosporangium aridum TaxID=2030 RepID=UPI000690AC7C
MVAPDSSVFQPRTSSRGWSHHRVGKSDVEWLEQQTRALRAADHQSGGGACLSNLLKLIDRVQPMLGAASTEVAQEQLHVAVADLYNLAGWACFDIGRSSRARAYFAQALALAAYARHNGLTANIFYRLGRICLHHKDPAEALHHFQLGLRATTGDNGERAASILTANQAWAHAAMGNDTAALRLLHESQELLALADPTHVPGWESFFTQIDLQATAGVVHTELARGVAARYAHIAIPALTEAISGYGDDMPRSRTFCFVALATCHLLVGDRAAGVHADLKALSCAENLTSTRIRDRMHPLHQVARRNSTHTCVRELTVLLAKKISQTTQLPVVERVPGRTVSTSDSRDGPLGV